MHQTFNPPMRTETLQQLYIRGWVLGSTCSIHSDMSPLLPMVKGQKFIIEF